MTPVYKKAEFWVTLGTSLSGILLAFGVITKEQSDGISQYLPNVVGGIMAILSALNFTTCQTKAKIEVFRAMCALSSTGDGQAKAAGTSLPSENVTSMAEKAGL